MKVTISSALNAKLKAAFSTVAAAVGMLPGSSVADGYAASAAASYLYLRLTPALLSVK